MKVLAAGAVAMLVSLGLVMGVAVIGAVSVPPALAAVPPITAGLCLTTGPLPSLSEIQATNARTVEVARRAGVAGGAGLGQQPLGRDTPARLADPGTHNLDHRVVVAGPLATLGRLVAGGEARARLIVLGSKPHIAAAPRSVPTSR